MRRIFASSETKIRRSTEQRITIIKFLMSVFTLIIVARLIEIQIIRYTEFSEQAQAQHFGDVRLSVKRGDILSASSKTDETSILGTSTTLNMLYIDPTEVSEPSLVAETVTDLLVTEEIDALCRQGSKECPREIQKMYRPAFDVLEQMNINFSGAILEPIPVNIPINIDATKIPDFPEIKRQFARSIETNISSKRVTFMPLVYGANKKQIAAAKNLNIAGITIDENSKLIYANPEEMNQLRLPSTVIQLSSIVNIDTDTLQRILRSRPLRYIPIMRKINPEISNKISAALKLSAQKASDEKKKNPLLKDVHDVLRGVVLKPESWRYYPDETLAAQVIGFTNDQGQSQYGIERTFNPQLRGKEGRIRSASDSSGLQIITSDQKVEVAKDGDSIALSIDRIIQKKVEEIVAEDYKKFNAKSGQVIVMDPMTGKIIAMVNAPLFNANEYSEVYDKVPIYLQDEQINSKVLVELYNPDTNLFVVRGEINQILTSSGRTTLSTEKQQQINEIEALYNIPSLVRYYYYTGQYERKEIFPTENPNVWLKFKNDLGVGAYLNRTTQEIYEPGSVLKAVTMAIAIDQGELTPNDTYNDNGPVEVDEYTIHNALKIHYGTVTMTNCLEFSINTCMTMVSEKLGRKLFHRALTRFGFGSITGIELEDELSGELRPWKTWSASELATHSFGQGISATPLQVVTAFSALANGGKLMKPSIIDSIIHADGTRVKAEPHIVDQVIKPETSETITAMLVSTINRGYGRTAKIPGYKIAGKTGTSQIAGPSGKYDSGENSTITTFAGYAPISHPKFTILVKFDRPNLEYQYGSNSSALTFKKIAQFLFDYYGIPPDEH